MERVAAKAGKMTKLGFAALAIAAVSAPLATAFAVAEEAPAEPVLTAEQVEQARQIFNDNSCNACHVLADAKASGTIGPALDGNATLDKAYTANIIVNGQGAMPSFSWLEPADIDLLAEYIIQTKK